MNTQSLMVITIGSLLLFSGCSESGPESERASPQTPVLNQRVAILMGGWPHAEAITETGAATAFRILNPEDPPEEEKTGPGVPLTKGQRQALVEALARDDAYLWDEAKDAEPKYGVLVTFEDGGTYARVRFCFKCQMLEYRPGSKGFFGPINDELVEWVKGVFPDDEGIQKLGTPED